MVNLPIQHDLSWDFSDTSVNFDERLTFDLYDDAYEKGREEFLRVGYEIIDEMKEILEKGQNLGEGNIEHINQEIDNLIDDLSEAISDKGFKKMGERI